MVNKRRLAKWIGGIATGIVVTAATYTIIQDDEVGNFVLTNKAMLENEAASDGCEDLDEKILSEAVHSEGANTLYVLIPPWHGHLGQCRDLKDEIKDAGHSYIDYSFPIDMLSPNPEATVDAYNRIEKRIRQDISQAKQEHGYSNVYMRGMSMGCVNTLMVADNNPDVNGVSLVLAGDNLATCMWEGARTQHLRAKMESQGITLDQLQSYWHSLAPENNLGGLQDKDIRIVISHDDKIIPTQLHLDFVRKMKEKGLSPEVIEYSIRGHYLTALDNLNNTSTLLHYE